MQIDVCSIRLDGDTQPRFTMDWVIVAEYAERMEAGDTFPPIVVFYDGVHYWLADGFHRVKAAEKIGAKQVDADVRRGTLDDARWYSYGANAVHGLRRSNEDKRRAVERALSHPKAETMTDVAIAAHCGVSGQMVGNYRKTIIKRFNDNQERVIIRNGSTYTMHTANIGKKNDDVDLYDVHMWMADNALLRPSAEMEQGPEVLPVADRKPTPRLIVGRAEALNLDNDSIDLIITSPPYNLKQEYWPMGGNGRAPKVSGIGYALHSDEMSESDYQDWQRAVLRELYRVAKPGASLFYNHKVRNRDGAIIHPVQWLSKSPWRIRQEIIWDRGSTHNHGATLFWPHDERIYWMTKGSPILPNRPLGMPTIWRFHGPIAGTWHPAPFSEELPWRILQAIARDGITVLDPFAGSCTTLKMASQMGLESVGVDISSDYLKRAAKENGWICEI